MPIFSREERLFRTARLGWSVVILACAAGCGGSGESQSDTADASGSASGAASGAATSGTAGPTSGQTTPVGTAGATAGDGSGPSGSGSPPATGDGSGNAPPTDDGGTGATSGTDTSGTSASGDVGASGSGSDASAVGMSGASGSPGTGNDSGTSGTSSGGTSGTSSNPANGGNPPRKYVNNGAACGATASWGFNGMASMPDPTMTKEGNTYYVSGTEGGFLTSTDRTNWKGGGSLFPNRNLPAWTHYLSSPDLWAADIHKENGKYYAYYAISMWGNYNSSIGLATSSSAAGPWTDQGMVVDYKTGGSGVNVIDPDLFVDDDGTWWLTYGSFKSGLRLIQLDPATGKAMGGTPQPTVLTKSMGEGSDLIKHNGYYYMFASRGKCCAGLQSTYQVAEGRSKSVKGPYLGSNGVDWGTAPYTIFLTGDSTHPGVGGQSFFRDDDGQLYMVYMAYTAGTKPVDGAPVLNVRPMWFDANDWPTLDPCKAATY